MTDARSGMALQPGRTVSLLGLHRGHAHAGTLRSWDVGDAGLVVTADVSVDRQAVDDLADGRVWLSTESAGEGEQGIMIFAAAAQAVASDVLRLTGVASMVSEPRRHAVRAEEPAPVTITRGPEHRELTAVDLSRSGVRVALSSGSKLDEGEHVQIKVDLADGMQVNCGGTVIRVDEEARQAVVQFAGLRSDVGDVIDRYVLLRIAGQ